jgi:hypothetical protein
MPYEAWHDKKPTVHHLHTFGCMAYMEVTRPHSKIVGKREPSLAIKKGAKATASTTRWKGTCTYRVTLSSMRAHSGAGTTTVTCKARSRSWWNAPTLSPKKKEQRTQRHLLLGLEHRVLHRHRHQRRVA